MVKQDSIQKPTQEEEFEDASKSRLRLWIALLRTVKTTESEVRERFRTEFDTTLPRFDVLSALYRFPDGLKMSELSDLLLVSNGSASVVVDRLVKDGMIKRNAVPGDRRALSVKLTKQGTEKFKERATAHETWIDQLLCEITPKQARHITKILDSNKKPMHHFSGKRANESNAEG